VEQEDRGLGGGVAGAERNRRGDDRTGQRGQRCGSQPVGDPLRTTGVR
jgi:hypothetical protein